MKIYIPDYYEFAGHWIYRGYQNAWRSMGYPIAYDNVRATEDVKYAIRHPGNLTTELKEEYILMAVDHAISIEPEAMLRAIHNSYKSFIFVQPNNFPQPWGSHPNFVTHLSDQHILQELNGMENVYLWTFVDVDPTYYSQWKKVHTIPLAYDSIGYKHIPDEKYKKFDISFVGGWANNGFDEKRKIMVDVFSKFMDSGLKCGFFVNKNLTHEQECKVLHNSRVTLNVHDAYQRALGLDTNERTFKSLGLNGCLVSDTVGQLNHLLPNIKTSLESEELVQITKDYLSLTDAELNVIKEENRQLILDKHCYTNRVEALLAL